MKTILIVYHSMTGGTVQMAQAAAGGARSEPALRVSMLRAEDAQATDVLDAGGFIFATPENLAAMSGKMKDFFDRTYYAALDRLNGRPYATLICAGSDGRSAAQQIERIATGWRLRGGQAREGSRPSRGAPSILIRSMGNWPASSKHEPPPNGSACSKTRTCL